MDSFVNFVDGLTSLGLNPPSPLLGWIGREEWLTFHVVDEKHLLVAV
jgi:hypothetical protein